MSRRRPKRKAAEAAQDPMCPSRSREYRQDSPSIFPLLPKEIDTSILEFLTKSELVHTASLVSLEWCQATRSPALWTSLDVHVWKVYPIKPPFKMIFTNITQFLIFLQRPQFARLNKLVAPDMYRTVNTNVFDRLAQVCPYLEELNVSGCISIRNLCLIPYGHELPRFPRLFPHLNAIHFSTRIFLDGVVAPVTEFAKGMGERLVRLYIDSESNNPERGLTDECFQAIARNCSNLETFEYSFSFRSPSDSGLSERGPIELIERCTKLTSLDLTVPLSLCERIGGYVWDNGLDTRFEFHLRFPAADEEESDEE